MDNDTRNLIKQLAALQIAARKLVDAVDDLGGVELPHDSYRRLIDATDVVRHVLGDLKL